MPPDFPIATISVIVATAIVSVRAFRDGELKDRFIFRPDAILAGKEYYRLFTSALLHADASHLAFNMLTLYLFGRNIELFFGVWQFLLIYFASIIGGSLLSLYLHRNHEYFALGASGGVCGIMFSSIFLFPGGDIMMMIPIPIPSWIYAILFLLSEFINLRGQRTNIGHDAHIGGAIVGLLVATALFPQLVRESPRLYATVMLLAIAMFIYFWTNSLHLPLCSFFGEGSRQKTKVQKQTASSDEIDAVLEKVSRSGLQSLTKKERRILDEASRK